MASVFDVLPEFINLYFDNFFRLHYFSFQVFSLVVAEANQHHFIRNVLEKVYVLNQVNLLDFDLPWIELWFDDILFTVGSLTFCLCYETEL